MSVGSNLQEMENVVTKGAGKADPMQKMAGASYEDLGGPTPENYKTDDNSAKLNVPGSTLKQVKDVANSKAGKADPAPKGMKEEEEVEGETIAEDEVTETEATVEETVTDEETVEEETTETEGEVVAEQEEVVEYDLEQDVSALLSGEDLSEEFQEKARPIFETAIKAKVAEVQEELKAQYESQLTEEVATIKESLTDRLDGYLEYVADEWMSENQLAVEAGLKADMSESFLQGMKGLFEEHYVNIPEEKYDVLNSMVEKLDEMEDKLNEQIERNIALNQRLSESVADTIIADVAEGLAMSQKEKLTALAENVEFDGEESYREKLVTLRDSYFSENAGAQRDTSETISEGTSSEVAEQPSGLMEAYLQTLNRVSKK